MVSMNGSLSCAVFRTDKSLSGDTCIGEENFNTVHSIWACRVSYSEHLHCIYVSDPTTAGCIISWSNTALSRSSKMYNHSTELNMINLSSCLVSHAQVHRETTVPVSPPPPPTLLTVLAK